MKKLFLSLFGFIFCGTVWGQFEVDEQGRAVLSSGLQSTTEMIPGLSLEYTGGAGRVGRLFGAIMIDSDSIANVILSKCEGTTSFSVTSIGQIFARQGLIQSSDSTEKADVEKLDSSLDKIKLLRGIRFNYKPLGTEGEPMQTSSPHVNSFSTSAGELSDYALSEDEISPEVYARMEAEKTRQRIGLVAQEVEAVLPEVVRTLPDGTKGIMYGDLVGVLVEGIKELQDSLTMLTQQLAEMEDLRSRVEQLETLVTPASPQRAGQQPAATDEMSGKDLSSRPGLQQNRPNPFNGTTEIGYRLPRSVKKAFIGVYDLNGYQLKRYDLSGESTGTIVISGADFVPGVYLYSLVVNGQEIDTKRMILSE